MKYIISNWSRLCCMGISLALIFCMTSTTSYAQCDFVPGDDALFNNAGYNAVGTNQVCYLIDAAGNVVASDPTGACDFTGVPYGAYSVCALNDCTADATSDIIAVPPTTEAEIIAYSNAPDVDKAGPVPFTVCPPSMLTACEGEDVIVNSMPDYDPNNGMMYVLVCDGEVVGTSMGAPTATMTIPDDGNSATGPASCTAYALNYCTPGGDATATGIMVGDMWTDADPTGDSNFDITSAPIDLDGCPLPLNLTSFEGACLEEGGIKLNWTTESEENVDKFIIERSLTGTGDFVQLGAVAALGNQGTNSYTFLDPRTSTKAYYRLIIVDLDGSTETTTLVLVECTNGGFGITAIHPNPTKDRITITFETGDRSPINFKLIDVLGRVLMEEAIVPELGINTKEVDFNFLASAVYFVVLENDKKQLVEKVIKRNY